MCVYQDISRNKGTQQIPSLRRGNKAKRDARPAVLWVAARLGEQIDEQAENEGIAEL